MTISSQFAASLLHPSHSGKRFLRRLSVGAKLWIMTVIFSVPILGLGAVYIQSLGSTLWFTATEQRGFLLFESLDRFDRVVSRRAELRATNSPESPDPAAELRQLTERADSALAAFAILEGRDGNAHTHAGIRTLAELWNALNSSKSASVAADLSAHATLMDASPSERHSRRSCSHSLRCSRG
jgi:hypothetical protein